MSDGGELPEERTAQRKAAQRTALILGIAAVAVYAWAILSHL
jgi:hypothetical protein